MSVADLAFIGIGIFILAVIGLVVHFAVGSMVSHIISIPQVNQSQEAVNAFQSSVTTSNKIDLFILAAFIGFVLALIITSWFIPSNTIFMVLYWIVSLVIVLVSILLSNVWEQITQSGNSLTSSVSSLPITNFLLLHLPIVMSIVVFIGLVVMYAKPREAI